MRGTVSFTSFSLNASRPDVVWMQFYFFPLCSMSKMLDALKGDEVLDPKKATQLPKRADKVVDELMKDEGKKGMDLLENLPKID